MSDKAPMTSNRPYLVRAMYEWISDNGLTPYVLVDARRAGVEVPQGSVKDGQIVLNVAMRAVSELKLANDVLTFHARFGGVNQRVLVPVEAVLAIYAQENGQGMMFPAEPANPMPPVGPAPQEPQRPGARLRVVK